MHLLFEIFGCGGATAIFVQIRVHLRDRADRNFARYVFDHSLKTDGMDGYTRMIKARRAPFIKRAAADGEISRTDATS